MNKRFDIFLYGEMGPMWVGAVETFEDAKLHIENLRYKQHVGKYAIFNLSTKTRVFIPRTPGGEHDQNESSSSGLKFKARF